MKIPDWYSLLLLGVATWRTFQLIAFDTILNAPRRKLLRLNKEWRSDARVGTPEAEVGEFYRLDLALWLTCPYCAGFWIGVGWLTAWEITQKWTELFALLFVLGAFAIAGHKLLAKDEDK